MRAFLVGLTVVVVGFVGGACGDEDGTSSVASGDLPRLPLVGTPGGAEVRTAEAGVADASTMAGAPEPAIAPAELVTYRLADGVEGLDRESAPAYRLETEASDDDVARLADRLGVDVDEIDTSSGPYWSYNADMAVSSAVAVACDSEAADGCPPPKEPEPPADLPSKDEALRIAGKVLGDGFDLVVGDRPEQLGWVVTGDVAIDGLPVRGLASTVIVGSRGEVTSASGSLVDAERLGEYALASRDEIEKRLPSMTDAVLMQGAEPTTREVVLTKATLVLTVAYGVCEGDPSFLVPAYEFEPHGLVVPAVDESLMAAGDGGGDSAEPPCPDVGVPEPAVRPEPDEVPPAPPADAGEVQPGR